MEASVLLLLATVTTLVFYTLQNASGWEAPLGPRAFECVRSAVSDAHACVQGRTGMLTHVAAAVSPFLIATAPAGHHYVVAFETCIPTACLVALAV
eukprot:787607-Rhodomonas_salina.1